MKLKNKKLIFPAALTICLLPIVFLFVNAGTPGWQPELRVEFFSRASGSIYTAAQAAYDFESDSTLEGYGTVTSITTGALRALRITYKQGVYSMGAKLRHRMSSPVQLAEACADINVPTNFTAVKGGKLPLGFGGSTNGSIPTGGSYRPNGTDGFSARVMWHQGDRVSAYVYHAGQILDFGDAFYHTQLLQRGRWDNICIRVQLNQVGQSNGSIHLKVNGIWNTFSGFNFRSVSTLNIDHYLQETFFGGGDASYAPTTDQTIDYDRFHVQAFF